MAQHTPAPWKANWNKHYFQIDSEKDGLIGDACASQFIEGNTDEGKANALLMAAAPELLEALEEIEERIDEKMGEWSAVAFDYLPESMETLYEIRQSARVAIAKAKGES